MITKEQFIEVLDKQKLTAEQREQMIELVQPFYDFNSFLKEKFKKSEEEIEKMINEYSTKRMEEYSKYLEEILKDENKSVIQESILLTSKVYGDFAREQQYDKCEALETSLATYLEIMMLEKITKEQNI